MNRGWVHHNHKIVPWNTQARRPQAGWDAPSQARPAHAAAAQLQIDTSIIIGVAVLVILLTMLPLLVVKIRNAERPTLVASILPNLQGSALELADKQRLLVRMSVSQRREFLSQVQYLNSIILRTNPKVDSFRIASAIVYESYAARFDPFLTAAVILAESSFKSNARSHVGARGLMQLRPTTAMFVCSQTNTGWRGSNALDRPDYNIKLGIAYLKHLTDLYGDNLDKILAAYNWGPGNLSKSLSHRSPRMPAVTQRYQRKVQKYYAMWKDAYAPYRAALRPNTLNG